MPLKFFDSPRKHFLLTAAYACLTAVYFTPLVAQEQGGAARRGRVDWIFVLDTSASMQGAGGSTNIFDKVKTALETFIDSTEEGDSVTIYTFDRDTSLRPTVRISDDTDRRDLRNIIRDLNATGDRTHTGKAIRDALDRARELRSRGAAERRTPSIVLLTDGIEDVRGIPDPVSIPSNVQRIPSSLPYIFYVSLGQEHDRQLEEFIRNPALEGRGRVLRDPNANNVQNLGQSIREPVEQAAATAPTPAPTPLHVNIRVEPVSLDFGEVKPGRQTGRETVNLISDADIAVQIALEGQAPGITVAEPSGPISLKASESKAVSVRLAVANDAANGARTFLLKANVRDDTGSLPTDAVIKTGWSEGRLAVVYVPLWRRIIWWLAIILLILLVALIAYCAVKGTTPWGLRDEIKNRRMLSGELELLRPSPSQPEQAYINLSELKSPRLVLSHVVPEGATGADDAELEGTYAAGNKGVRLRTTSGGVRVNGAEVSFADLYNGDTIELGDARLRFNWVDHERPSETDDGLG